MVSGTRRGVRHCRDRSLLAGNPRGSVAACLSGSRASGRGELSSKGRTISVLGASVGPLPWLWPWESSRRQCPPGSGDTLCRSPALVGAKSPHLLIFCLGGCVPGLRMVTKENKHARPRAFCFLSLETLCPGGCRPWSPGWRIRPELVWA